MNVPEVYCDYCMARDYCDEKPDALPPLKGHAEPECFVDKATAKRVEVGENFEIPF